MAYRKVPAGGGSWTPVAVPYAASVVLDMSRADNPHFIIGTLTGPIAISFINGHNSQAGRVTTEQDATGGRIITWDAAKCAGSDDMALPAASTTPNKLDVFGVTTMTARALPYLVTASNRGF